MKTSFKSLAFFLSALALSGCATSNKPCSCAAKQSPAPVVAAPAVVPAVVAAVAPVATPANPVKEHIPAAVLK